MKMGTDADIRRLAVILRDSNDAITVLGLEGNITAWNKGAEKMYGYTESEALRMNISQIILPDKKKEERSLLNKLLPGELLSHTKRSVSQNQVKF